MSVVLLHSKEQLEGAKNLGKTAILIRLHNFEVRHPRCVESKFLNGKSTVNKQLYLLAMSGWIT